MGKCIAPNKNLYICNKFKDMEITDEIIDHIANLSKLEFNNEEKANIRQDMNKIINFMSKLSEVDTEGLDPLIFMSHEINRLREDQSKVTVSKGDALKNAAKHDSDYFRIPKVLHGN